MSMTRAEALRALVTAPREVPDDSRIGHRVIHAEPDDATIRIHRGWRDDFARWKRQHAPRHRKEVA